ncbi:hypothetical protein P153DRAFT_345141 [Dothidotthia symphoricarpi CBS 119687]|uniref:Uncharacterized protein n=1 Tax=Dothidotthia symphoricarpi CBS 119687 TaxID=1392245 RepID=A0A6A6A8E5_9PLEO|nr:uncharacterized protein P153DRAFT_345141 [Dothidotthia symphoricarpi CBS 119687]KAF2127443.1 hypothetical protein P153DRAFT_345141 [Dothidotthia symphoricarpi CBS 119687]
MATETTSRTLDRHTRKRPFAGWMKRLANLKPSSSDSPSGSGKKSSSALEAKAKKAAAKNYPYPESAYATNSTPARHSVSTTNTPHSHESLTSAEGCRTEQNRAKSTAPTVATVPETVHSMRSKADTGSNFVGGNSTFSSPNASEHSLTTTLTTIQSTAPSNILAAAQPQPTPSTAPPVHFSHQFPTSPPPSAIPPHLAPHQQPHSYQGATANNILTDNASILTLASSSKRRRRNSADTNASVRALAPSSQYGGSRESLPLSILSATADAIYSPSTRPSGFPNPERVSLYSASGVTAPVLSSERNSYYAAKQNTNADGLSVRSGLLGHGRTESISSMRANPTSPLASPRDQLAPAKISRQSLDWTREASDGEEEVLSSGVPLDKGKARVAA